MREFLRAGARRVITMVVPVLLILTSVRLLLTPAFLQVEYRMPGFPEDPYGFSFGDRLTWSGVSLDYLLNDEGIAWLAEKTLSAGVPLYNDRELRHMLDVKMLVQAALRLWLGCAVVVVGLVVLLWG